LSSYGNLNQEVFLKPSTLRAIFTDSHFWVPVVVLVLGIALLVYLR